MSENPFLQRMKLNALDIGGEVEAPKQEEKQDEKKFEIPQEVVTAGIPLLVGALMGKPSIGAKVGAKTIAEGLNRQYEIEKEQRKKIASGDEKLYSYVDPLTGKKTYGFSRDAYGNEPVAASYIGLPETQTRLNMRSQMQAVTHAKKKEIDEQEEIQKGLREGKYGDTFNEINVTPDMKKQAEQLETKFYQLNKNQIEGLNAGNEATRLLAQGVNKNNISAFQMGVKKLAATLEKGKLTDKDVALVQDRLSLIDLLQKRMFEEKTGKPKPEIVAEMQDAIKTIRGVSEKYVRGSAKKMATARAYNDPKRRDFYMSRLSPYFPEMEKIEMPVSSKVVVTNGKETYTIDRADLAEAQKDGFNVVEK